MEMKKYSRECKLEAVSLMKKRAVAIVQAARNFNLNHNLWRRWLKELDAHIRAIWRRGEPDALLHYSDQGSP
jgi:transposase-like protein